MRLSNSRLKTYRRCPKQYEFKYVMGLKTRREDLPRKRGSWLHELLMTHYDGEDWKYRHQILTAKFMEMFEEEREELGDLPAECHRIMVSYLQHWARHDRGLRVVDSELDELMTLPNGDEFNFIIDLIVEESDGGLWLWDHKTVGNFMDAEFMLIDAQLARYFWAAERMGYTPLRGIVFNELSTRVPTVPKFLKASGRLEMRKNIRCDVYTYYREILQRDLDPRTYASFLKMLMRQSDQWFRRTKLPKDKPLTDRVLAEMMMTAREIKAAVDLNEFPRTPDRSCTWGCDFLHPCMIQLQGGEIDQVLKLRYTKRGDREEQAQ
jgi:hypothetical protein